MSAIEALVAWYQTARSEHVVIVVLLALWACSAVAAGSVVAACRASRGRPDQD